MKRILSLFLALIVAGLLATPAALAYQKKKTSSKAVTAPVIPAGTPIAVRIIDELNSGKSKPGDTFRGTLERPIVSGSTALYPKGADVTGRVVAAKGSGRLTDPGILELELTSVSSGSKKSYITTEPFVIEGESHTKSNVTKIGGGAAAGAIIGAIAGGGKGAAIGAGVGAAAGTGVAAATGKKEASVESEAVLEFKTSAPSSSAPASSAGGAAPAAQGVKSYDEGDPSAYSFSARDRRVIRTCFEQHASGLPPGLAKRESLPPGLERQLQKNGTLPPGLQKKVQPLPQVCESELTSLPRELERVVLSRRVMVINSAYKILDIFDLDAQ
ncbi:MAG TPA: hypothetical protein VNK82_00270 [Terriglobales bacterium]|nr:hypothetical protein [Terriglobales bacterium]